MKRTLIYGSIGGLLIYLYLRSKKSKGEKTSVPTKPYVTDEFGQPKVGHQGTTKLDVPPVKPQTKPYIKPPTKPYIKPQTKPYISPPSKPPVRVDNKPISKPSFYTQREFYSESEQNPTLPKGDSRTFTIPRINQKRPAKIQMK